MATSSLVKTARGLDQGGPETVPEKLDQVWTALCSTAAGDFYAAEAVILRWLLKHMGGNTDDAERLRRLPLAWSILGCCFGRIPLFSLAKSLADRRFIAILQQTASDLARPHEKTEDVEMGNGTSSLKRKRTEETPYNLDTLRHSSHALRSAEALFSSLKILLGRLSSSRSTDQYSGDKTGSEHLKSLFCSPVDEALTILAPLLRLCYQALAAEEDEPLEEQEAWVGTFDSIWKLHLQSPSDASMAAASLAPRGCVILGRLLGVPKSWKSPAPALVTQVWSKDLRHFLMNTVILPARSAFLNREQTGILDAAIGDTASASSDAALKSAVLFYLVLKAPPILGKAKAKFENEKWIQKVFDLVEKPLQLLPGTERNEAISDLLNMAAQQHLSPSLASLRAICTNYALQAGNTDWQLISSVARCDADAFIVSPEGPALLELLFQRLSVPSVVDQADIESVSEFLISLARGFASARDLSGFVKKWFEHLAGWEPGDITTNTAASACFGAGLSSAVGALLQPSLSTQQLVSLLSWLKSQDGPNTDLARRVIFAALSGGISAEEYADAVGTGLLVPVRADEGSLPSEVQAMSWQLVSRALGWATFEQAKQIWSDIKSPVVEILAQPEAPTGYALEVFKCAYTASMALKYDQDGIDARAVAVRFLSRLGASGVEEILGGSPRLIRWLLEAGDELPDFITAVVPTILSRDSPGDDGGFLESLFLGMVTVHARGAASIDTVLSLFFDVVMLRPWQQQSRKAARALLSAPKEILTRPWREKFMKCVLSIIGELGCCGDNSDLLSDYALVLSLATRLMTEPTYYEDMAFQDLVDLGTFLDSSIQHGSVSDALGLMDLFRHLVALVMRQMTSTDDEREELYLMGAAEVMSAWPETVANSHLVLLSVFLDAFLTVSKRISGPRGLDDHAEFLASMPNRLAAGISSVLKRTLIGLPGTGAPDAGDSALFSTCVALDAAKMDNLRGPLREQMTPHLLALEGAACAAGAPGTNIEWKLKVFLAQHFESDLAVERELQFKGILPELDGQVGPTTGHSEIYAYGDVLFEDYLRVVASNRTEEDLLSYLEELVKGEGMWSPGQLLAMYYVAKQISGKIKVGGGFDLATAHSILALHLPRSSSPTQFEIITQTLVMLLDKKAGFMSQWNIESTLSGVSAVCLGTNLDPSVTSSPRNYLLLCRLVEIIIKRHRVRLEGHFHLLIMTLQALLRRLVTQRSTAQPTDKTKDAPSVLTIDRKVHAKRFSRLLELVCEPSVASVTRTQRNMLNSATEAAKRSAGQHMYLVLVAYIKLQLEHSIPVAVREALEPGIFSILSITTDEGRAIMNDAMDSSGRAIFREVYKRWQRFGKWKGV